jgi:hypothetical protein
MALYSWPHAHLAHAIADFLSGITDAGARVTTRLPRERVYPLVVVQPAGLGPLGTDSAIQADEVRLQIDAWASTQEGALAVAAQVLRLLDARFDGALKDTVLTVEDEGNIGDWYECRIERVSRSGGGDPFYDEFAKVFRCPAFYNCKINV